MEKVKIRETTQNGGNWIVSTYPSLCGIKACSISMQQERGSKVDAAGTTLRLCRFCRHIESKGKKTEERKWCVGRPSCRIIVVRQANVWRRQGDQRCMRLERPEAHTEGLTAWCGKGCYFWRLRFPFLPPLCVAFPPAHDATSRFSQLIHFCVSTIEEFKPHGPFDFRMISLAIVLFLYLMIAPNNFLLQLRTIFTNRG